LRNIIYSGKFRLIPTILFLFYNFCEQILSSRYLLQNWWRSRSVRATGPKEARGQLPEPDPGPQRRGGAPDLRRLEPTVERQQLMSFIGLDEPYRIENFILKKTSIVYYTINACILSPKKSGLCIQQLTDV
jgi:hypothetical protein